MNLINDDDTDDDISFIMNMGVVHTWKNEIIK